MTPGRRLAVAVVGSVAAGLLLALASTRPWSTLHLHGTVEQSHEVSGRSYTDVPFALGWLAAAAGVALLATRRWGRVGLGALVALAGLIAAVTCVREALHGTAEVGWASFAPVSSVTTTKTPWPWVGAVAAALLVGLGAWVVVRGRSWPGMGERYDAPAGHSARVAARDVDPWDALDRGEDPTA